MKRTKISKKKARKLVKDFQKKHSSMGAFAKGLKRKVAALKSLSLTDLEIEIAFRQNAIKHNKQLEATALFGRESVKEGIEKIAGNMDTSDKRNNNRRKPTNILQEADSLINGDRTKAYGPAVENHDNIANLWNAYIRAASRRKGVRIQHMVPMSPLAVKDNFCRCEDVVFLNAVDIEMMNVLQNVARVAIKQSNTGAIIDIAGYAGCADQVLNNK